VIIARGGQKQINCEAQYTKVAKIHKDIGKKQQNIIKAPINPKNKLLTDSKILKSNKISKQFLLCPSKHEVGQ
jgi:hypothetical protein